ncbi:TPA: hypothetical protein AB5B17_001137 [Vibrio mimicus]
MMTRSQFGRLPISEALHNPLHHSELRDYARQCWPPVANALQKALKKQGGDQTQQTQLQRH